MNQQFDVAVIDEAAQALEAVCWIPILKSQKLVLAGDHLQLPPTVKAETASSTKNSKTKNPTAMECSERFTKLKLPKTLSLTLFDRMIAMWGSQVKRMLNVQYRMCAFSFRTELMIRVSSPSLKVYGHCCLPSQRDVQ